jgi:hypothetical protein
VEQLRSTLLLVLLFLAGRPAAHASDPSSSNLMNLNYYPHVNKFEVAPHVTSTITSHSENSNNSTSNTAANEFTGAIYYGVAPSVRVSLVESLLWDSTTDQIGPLGNQVTTSAQGLSSPTLGVAWRYWEAPQAGFSGDISLTSTPSFGPKVAGDGNINLTGNNMNGSWNSTLSTALFSRQGFNEMELSGLVQRNYGGKTIGSAPTTSFTTKAQWTSSATLADRVHLGTHHFMQGSVDMNFSSVSQQTTGANVNRTVTTPQGLTPRLDFGYQPDPEIVLMLSVNYHQATTTSVAQNKTPVETTTTVSDGLLTLLHQF